MAANPGLGAAMAVLVAYRRPWREVNAALMLESALLGSLAANSGASSRLGGLLIYDNSPEPMARPDATLPNCEYVHDASNGGTRAAYAKGLALAQSKGLSWIVLLDHDTTLPLAYLEELDQRLSQPLDDSVGLLFPRVKAHEAVLSPAIINRWGSIIPVDVLAIDSVNARRAGSVTAVASASVIRVAALAAVGVIPSILWLDYLDHWLFRRVQALGYRAECLSSTVQHDLSILSATPPSPERLRNILRAERFVMRSWGSGARAAYPLRLLVRAAKAMPRDRWAAWMILRQLISPDSRND